MKITPIKIKIEDICKGFDMSLYSGSDEDVMCYDGNLNCRPAYQRNYVYGTEKVKTKDGKTVTKQEQVIDTIFHGYQSKTMYPLSIMYWVKSPNGKFQLMDGQQRTISVLLFKAGQFQWSGRQYTGLQQAEKDWFNNYEFTIYMCEQGDNQSMSEFEAETLEWFDRINIAGSPLKVQELLNANYFGPWVSSIKKYFSNDASEIFKDKYETEKYLTINKSKMNRQDFLAQVLEWRCEYLGKEIET